MGIEDKRKTVWNDTLIYITIAYFFINTAFFFHMTTMNGGSSLAYVFILPIFWLLTIILVGIFAYNQRKILFDKNRKKTSIILLILCTPFPYIIIGQIIGLLIGGYY